MDIDSLFTANDMRIIGVFFDYKCRKADRVVYIMVVTIS